MDLIGQRIRHLRIEERLGQGGMGEVYLARDLVLDRLVAVKSLRADQRLSEEGKARFLREARLLSKLGDPGICQIYEIVETPEADFLVLEYVRGRTLRAAGGELGFSEKLGILAKVARALAFAHRAGIVHRDLKADNVMVTPEGEIKILDFGVGRSLTERATAADGGPEASGAGGSGGNASGSAGAAAGAAGAAGAASALASDELADLGETERLAPRAAAAPRAAGAAAAAPVQGLTTIFAGAAEETLTVAGDGGLTRQGTVVGTLGAMSPEQAAGAPISEASDLYSFGILMQELLSGRSAYGEIRGVALWNKVLRAEVVPCPNLTDPDLRQLLAELLSLDPLRRPGAELVAARLVAIAEKPERERKQRRRRQAISAAFLTLLIGLAFTLYLALAARKARDIAEKRRQVAEDLIAFMLGDLTDKLQGVGRLDILDAVDERALAYFEALPEGELTAAELGWRLQGMRQVADAYRAKGDLPRALAVIERAKNLHTRDAARFADEQGVSTAFVDLQAAAGQIAFDRSDYDKAEALWRDCLQQAERLAARWPNTRTVTLGLASAEHNLGSLLVQLDQHEEAIAHLRRSLAAEEELIRAGDLSAQVVNLRAATRAYLSRALERRGDLRGALEVRRQYLAELAAALAAEPENAAYLFDLAVARGFVANLEMVLGESVAAADGYRRGGEEMAKLAAADPQNAEAAVWLGRFHSAAAMADFALGRRDPALADLASAQGIFETLLRSQPDQPDVSEGLGLVHLRRGLIFEELAPGRALLEAKRAGVLLRASLPNADPGQRALIAAAELLRGRLLTSLAGNPAEIAAAYTAAEAVLAPLARPLQATSALEVELEIALHRGATGAAREIFARLDAMGWRAPRRAGFERLLEEQEGS